MNGQLSAPTWQARRFGHWVAQSRWWPEGAVVVVNQQAGVVESVAAPPLAVSAPPPAEVRLPTVLVVRYLASPVGELLADGAARLPTGASPTGNSVLPVDTTPEVIKAATLAVAELVVDVESGPKGDTVVCRQLTIRPGDAKGRWTALPWHPQHLIEPDTGRVLPSSDGGRIYGLGRLPVEEMLERYLTFWGSERGLKPGRRPRVFTSDVLDQVAVIARENPARPVRAVAEHFGWRTPDGDVDRWKAQRAVSKAIAEGRLPADTPGLRRSSRSKQQTPQMEGMA
jgi:hypothetical protein